jgi:thiamine biosynthesis lipoprotein
MKGHTARVPAIAMLATLAMLKFEFTQVHMGVTVRLTLFASNQSKATEAARVAFARFRELDDIMSDYQQNSELNRLCRAPTNEWTIISPDLYIVLRNAQRISVLTDGAFDVTSGPAVRLWRQARRDKRMPAALDLEVAKSLVNHRFLELDRNRARLLRPGMQLDLGGIAKGFACDEAIDALKREGVESAMVEAGGDISVSNPPPGSVGWRISILGWPALSVTIANEAMSTSGDAEQFLEIDGKKMSHVVDPRTAMAIVDSRQATVVGKQGWLTDALATSFCVIDRDSAETLAKKIGVRVWLKP